MPLVLDSPDPARVLQAYASLYLREEVQMEGLVRNIGNFSRFLEAISFSHASLLNISNVARDCDVERKVVEGYVGILEDLLLSCRVQVFTKRAKRAVWRIQNSTSLMRESIDPFVPKAPCEPSQLRNQRWCTCSISSGTDFSANATRC